jgi:hypothetical protein
MVRVHRGPVEVAAVGDDLKTPSSVTSRVLRVVRVLVPRVVGTVPAPPIIGLIPLFPPAPQPLQTLGLLLSFHQEGDYLPVEVVAGGGLGHDAE